MHRTLIILTAVLLSCRCAFPADKAKPAPGTNTAFTVTLTDGSVLMCHPKLKEVPLKTSYAELTIPIERISIISNSVTKGESTIAMKNGDIVRGKCGLTEIEVDSLLGKLKIPLAKITEIDARVKPKRTFKDSPSRKNACINNMRMIDSAKEQWALANRRASGDEPVIDQVNEYIKGNRTPICGAGGKYTYHVIGENPTCDCPGHQMPGW